MTSSKSPASSTISFLDRSRMLNYSVVCSMAQSIFNVHREKLTVALCTAPTMVINARAMERHLWMAQDAATDIGASKVNVWMMDPR